MFLHTFHPGPPLSRFVRSFWLYCQGPQPFARERGLPTGAPELVFDLSDDGFPQPTTPGRRHIHYVPGTVLCGARIRPFRVATDRPLRLLAVQFQPGGAYPFFEEPADELRDATAPLDALWGTQATELWERLMESPTVDAQFHLLEQALLEHTVRPLERRPAVAFALREFMVVPQAHAIRRIADQVGLSHARFIQVFREEVGLTPKQFCRVRRFVEVLRRTSKGGRVDWAELALACGYYDQAHLSRDFHRLAGVCPSTYVRDRSPHFPAYLILPDSP